MKRKEFNQLDAKALSAKLSELKLELMKVRVQNSMGSDPKISGNIRKLKRNIARVNTLQRANAVQKR